MFNCLPFKYAASHTPPLLLLNGFCLNISFSSLLIISSKNQSKESGFAKMIVYNILLQWESREKAVETWKPLSIYKTLHLLIYTNRHTIKLKLKTFFSALTGACKS